MFKKKTKLIHLILYFVTIGYLYYFHFKLYGSVLETAFFYIVFVPPVIFVLRYLFIEKISDKIPNKYITILFWSLFSILFVISLYEIYRNPYKIYLYFYIITFGVCVLARKKRTLNVIYSLLLALSIFAVTILFQGVSGICTLNHAKTELLNENYNNLQWVGACQPEVVSTIFNRTTDLEKSGLTKKEQSVDFYLFYGEQDNKKYGLFFSPLERKLFRKYEVNSKKDLLGYKSNSK